MKPLIFINLIVLLSSFQIQAQQLRYKNGRTAWNGSVAYHDNGKPVWNGTTAFYHDGYPAWNGTTAFHDDGNPAWNGTTAFYCNRKPAWNGSAAFHSNGKPAWNGTIAFFDDGQILSQNLYSQIGGVKLDNIEVNELEVSDKIKLLTKKLNQRVYVVGLKVQLSETNSVLINRENNMTTNIIQLSKDIHFEIVNKKTKLSVLGQNVINQKQ